MHDFWVMAAMVCQKCCAVFMGIANMQSCLCLWFGTTNPKCHNSMLQKYAFPPWCSPTRIFGRRSASHLLTHRKTFVVENAVNASFFNLSLKHPWKRFISKDPEKLCKGPFLKFLKALKCWNTTNLLLKTSEAKWWPGWIPPPSCCFANRGLSERRHAKTVTRCKLRR